MDDLETRLVTAARINAVHTAITILDTAQLHQMHMNLTENKIDQHLPDRLRRLIVLIENTPWQTEFDTKAQELGRDMRTLVEALTRDDLEQAKVLAGKVHGLYHSLVRDFYDELPKLGVKKIFEIGTEGRAGPEDVISNKID